MKNNLEMIKDEVDSLMQTDGYRANMEWLGPRLFKIADLTEMTIVDVPIDPDSVNWDPDLTMGSMEMAVGILREWLEDGKDLDVERLKRIHGDLNQLVLFLMRKEDDNDGGS